MECQDTFMLLIHSWISLDNSFNFIFMIPFPIVDRRENGMLKRKWDWISGVYQKKFFHEMTFHQDWFIS